MPTPKTGESSRAQRKLLDDENVLILTKATFFRTLRLLLEYAQHPERRTWEFFSYRAWDYILMVFCITFDIDGSAVSLGPQHPILIRRPTEDESKFSIDYGLPDFAILRLSDDKPEELILIGEVKPMKDFEPFTINAQNAASSIFLDTEEQRQRQSRLAFERHPEVDTIKILTMCGGFWSVWVYERSEFLFDLPPPATPSNPTPANSRSQGRGEEPGPSAPGDDVSDQSPPYKLRRTSGGLSFRAGRGAAPATQKSAQDGKNDNQAFSPVPSPPSDFRDRTWRLVPEEEPLEIDAQWDHQPPRGRVAGKKAAGTSGWRAQQRGAPSTPEHWKDDRAQEPPSVYHVLQLPREDALNPWFRLFLRELRDALIGEATEGDSVQKSWFDWPPDVDPVGDGYEPGYVLQSQVQLTDQPADEPKDLVAINRVDDPSEGIHRMGNILSPILANALMSPRLSLSATSNRVNTSSSISRTPLSKGRFSGIEDTVLPQLPETLGSEPAGDTTPTPTPQRHVLYQPTARERGRESSPTDIYLEREQQVSRQLHLAPSDFIEHAPPHPLHHLTSKISSTSQSQDEPGSVPSVEISSDLPLSAPSAPATRTASSSRAPSAPDFRDKRGGGGEPSGGQATERNAAKRRAHRETMLFGPLRAKTAPDGSKLPPDFAHMSRQDQEVYLCLATPAQKGGQKDFETAFRATGMPEEQVQQMMTYVRRRHTNSVLPSVLRDDSSGSRTTSESYPSTATAGPTRPVEPSSGSDGGDEPQNTGRHARTVPPRDRGGARRDDGNSRRHAPDESHGMQVSHRPNPHRQGDPVVATAEHLQTLHLEPQPPGSAAPSAGPGETGVNRKRKERQR